METSDDLILENDSVCNNIDTEKIVCEALKSNYLKTKFIQEDPNFSSAIEKQKNLEEQLIKKLELV
jgi:hypothetical protein